MEKGIELIAKERQRQIDVEGWTPEHDSSHRNNELLRAAECYIEDPSYRHLTNDDGETLVESIWPWDKEWWKPSPEDRIKELAKAGALIAAEIDRLQNL